MQSEPYVSSCPQPKTIPMCSRPSLYLPLKQCLICCNRLLLLLPLLNESTFKPHIPFIAVQYGLICPKGLLYSNDPRKFLRNQFLVSTLNIVLAKTNRYIAGYRVWRNDVL